MSILTAMSRSIRFFFGRLFAGDHVSIRHYIDWNLSFFGNSLDDERPWVNYRTIEWLQNTLNKKMKVFEYGSGGSTLFLATRAYSVVSVEHHPAWHEKVQKYLSKKRITNCKCILIPPEKKNKDTPYLSASKPGMDFKKYATYIRTFKDNHFDLIFIDGRARSACIREALPKVKIGGYLILDNSQRKDYTQAKKLLERYEKQVFYGLVPYQAESPGETTIWKIDHTRKN